MNVNMLLKKKRSLKFITDDMMILIEKILMKKILTKKIKYKKVSHLASSLLKYQKNFKLGAQKFPSPKYKEVLSLFPRLDFFYF